MTKQNEKDAKRVPELRFKGFADAWEQRKLGDVTDIKTGSRNHQDSVENGKYPFFVRSEKIERLDEYDFDTTAILIPGDGRIGEIFHYYDGKFALHQRVYKVDNFNGIDALFLLSLFRYSFRRHALRLNAQGTVPSLRLPMFTKWEILLPKLEEQEKIGQLFQSLDKTITLHEEKQRQLEQLKKALLQKMFADETGYPVLRFKGFTEKWEQVKLSKTSRSYSGGTPKVGVHEYYDGQIPFIRSGEIASKSTELTISKVGLNNSSAKLVSKGDILYALYGATSGEVSLSKINGAINQAILAIKPIDGYENYFLMTWLQKEKEQITRTYLQGGQGNLSAKIVMNLVVNIPSLSEQSQIAQIFSKLDKTITLHDKKIQYLKQLKRGLLQKMFV